MSLGSKIEWTDATWNPMRGCTKISPGCLHCYAEIFAERFRGVHGHPFEQGFDLRLVPEKLDEPLNWSTPRRIFVNSMSDLFHEGVPDEYIVRGRRDDAGRLAHLSDSHQASCANARLVEESVADGRGRPHIWWGVSVENKKYGVPRIQHLHSAPAAMKFLSIEPLLEDLGEIDLTDIDWVIVGGESGPGARPMLREWVVSIRRQCRQHGVPFFFKQWGGVRKKKAGRLLDGRTYDEMPVVGSPETPDKLVATR